jgi:hypothetical protein
LKCDKELNIKGSITHFEGYRWKNYFYATGFKLKTEYGKWFVFGDTSTSEVQSLGIKDIEKSVIVGLKYDIKDTMDLFQLRIATKLPGIVPGVRLANEGCNVRLNWSIPESAIKINGYRIQIMSSGQKFV